MDRNKWSRSSECARGVNEPAPQCFGVEIHTPKHRLSRSIVMTRRNHSERLGAIVRCAHAN